jgi:hypothetical protein
MSIFADIREAIDVLQKAGRVDLMAKIVALHEQALEIAEKLRDKEDFIRKLQESLAFKDVLVFRSGLYYNRKDGAGEERPYCPRCWEVTKIACHLADRFDTFDASGRQQHYFCTNCKSAYKLPQR